MAKIISVIGPPAIGKTLFCNIISETKGYINIKESEQMPERIIENIKNHTNFLLTELWFHGQMVKNIFQAVELKNTNINVIMDTHWGILEVWGKVVLKDKLEEKTFLQLVDYDKIFLPKPDIIIGLTCSEEQLYGFFKKRNALYDQGNDSFKRILELKKEYENIYEKYQEIKVINTSGMDFYNECDMSKIIDIIGLLNN